MTIERTISSSGHAEQSKKQWIAPTIQILNLHTARGGSKLNGKDVALRS